MRLDQKLRKLMAERHLKAPDISRIHGGVSPNTVRKWMTEEGDPSVSEVRWLAECFGVPVAYLADDTLDVIPGPELTDVERMALEIVRAKGLTMHQVINRLTFDPGEPRFGNKQA